MGWGLRCFANNPSPTLLGDRVVGPSHRVLELSGLREGKTAKENEAVIFLTYLKIRKVASTENNKGKRRTEKFSHNGRP